MKPLKQGNITSPLGFKTNALCCGIKKKKPDLALIYSITKAVAAGVFTSNRIKAAPVKIDIKSLKNNCAQAIIVNSGNANCCTGKRGYADAQKIVQVVAADLDLEPKNVLIASTGVIGKYLPLNKILNNIPELIKGLGFNKADKTALAIMTTDTYPKQLAIEIKLNGKKVTTAAVAKGAGMICPDMATMLCFITTDANISGAVLKSALAEAVDDSFNCISVDGQMSTNDTVIILANGLAVNKQIKKKGKEYRVFTAALKFLCLQLAKMIIEDAEGATKMIQVSITRARSKKEAKQAAYAIANSALVKTMVAGENPNWGRIPASLGQANINLKEEKIKISLQKKVVYQNAKPVLKDKDVLIALLKKKQVNIDVDLNIGNYSHTVWTADLTAEYVRINAEYS